MSLHRAFLFTFIAGMFLSTWAQPLVREKLLPENQNVRVGYVHDIDGDVTGDDYHGFTVAYASKVYPLDQMVISYTHLNPYQSTMRQVLLSIEEYWPVTERLSPYGSAGAGYLWTDYDAGVKGESHGWFGKLGFGLLYKTGTRFDLYAELAYQVSGEDLWLDGRTASKSNNTQAILGVRMNY